MSAKTFEEWADERGYSLMDRRPDDSKHPRYPAIQTEAAWQAWNASRAALLADMPDVAALVERLVGDVARATTRAAILDVSAERMSPVIPLADLRAVVTALESLAAQLAEVKKSATAWQGEYERVVAQLAEAQKVLKAAEERARRAEEDAGALREALDCLVCIVGLTAFKHPAQRAVLQEAIDAAIKVLRCPAIDAARAAK